MSRVAIVGCGVISRTYAHTMSQLPFVELAACVDEDTDRAEKLASKFGAQARSFDAVLADPDIDAVVNLTPPLAHAAVIRASLEAGKATFSEKPLGVEFAEGKALVELANVEGRAARLRARHVPRGRPANGPGRDRSGDIGEPLAANVFMLGSGPESWHPNPAIFYQHGAGPLLDMGPVLPHDARATPRAGAPGERCGEDLACAAADSVGAAQGAAPRCGSPDARRFAGGVRVGPRSPTLVTSFDVQATRYFNIEVYGTEATLSVPNPNTFGGPVQVRRNGDEAWTDVELLPTSIPQQRGIGLADMLWAQGSGRAHRTSGALALHVLELMTGALAAADQGKRVELQTTCEPRRRWSWVSTTTTFDD